MSRATAQSVKKYLKDHSYISLDDLASRTGTTPNQIRAFEEAKCIPATSYVVGGEMTFTSSFGTYKLPVEEERYYHPSIEMWIGKALTLAESYNLGEVARIVRTEFDNIFKEILNGATPPWPRGADYAWDFITDGTWGLCLKDITVESILTKEFARATIRSIVKPDSGHQLTEVEREELKGALADFERVALPFAPHEITDSCRHSEIIPAMEKYHVAP